ncbi:hypothetical protein J6590_077868 [Homalodisca vitripennis]|nr:hypothetical protein J6590_077868 [Homalodisca vitripennis]
MSRCLALSSFLTFFANLRPSQLRKFSNYLSQALSSRYLYSKGTKSGPLSLWCDEREHGTQVE